MEHRVYIIGDTGHNYGPAEEYGEIRFLFQESPNVFALDRLYSDIRDQLVDANSQDYFLPSGSTIANCVAFHILMNRFGFVNVLLFSFREGNYELKTIRQSSEEASCQSKNQ